MKGPSSPLKSLFDIEKVDLQIENDERSFTQARLLPGVALAVLVAGVPDHLPGQGEQLVPAGEHGGNLATNLGGGLVYRNL